LTTNQQVRFHPDKVPAGAPLAARVRAEEVSKILNSHDWGLSAAGGGGGGGVHKAQQHGGHGHGHGGHHHS
jgi:hypothetical protein